MGLRKWNVFLRILAIITVVLVIMSLLRIGWKSSRNLYLYESNTKSWIVNKSDSRTNELKRLEDLVQRRLLYLQNPKNCSSAEKVLCKFTDNDLRNISGIQVVQLPRNAQVLGANRPYYLPLSIPEDLADDLVSLHEFPSGWWIGQFLVYLTRPTSEVKQFIESAITTSGFRHPIVGIHVRRTDKSYEAPYQELSEYMKYVEEWFDKYEMTHGDVTRNVFIASDEPNVLEQAKQKYTSYTFVTNMKASKVAQKMKTRYSESSLHGIILDIEMLSMCDYVVCTFTSNVGNIVYELMQVRYWDAPSRIKSLDIGFSFRRVIDWNRNRKVTKENPIGSVSMDNKQNRVKMPTYPEVPRL